MALCRSSRVERRRANAIVTSILSSGGGCRLVRRSLTHLPIIPGRDHNSSYASRLLCYGDVTSAIGCDAIHHPAFVDLPVSAT